MTPKAKSRVLIYTRVSEARGPEETSTDRQLGRCEAYATAQDWTVVARETDLGISGFTGKERPGWARTVAAVEAGAVDAVLVFALDRAGRNAAALLKFVETCKAHGVAFVSATQPIDTGSTYGGIVIAVLAAVAEIESAVKRERMLSKIIEKTANGQWVGGSAPFGYANLKAEKSIVIVESEAAAVRTGVALLLNNGTLAGVARAWNEAGVLTRDGYQWKAQTVRQMLRSETIAGLQDGKRAGWEPILTRTDWERVQAIFDNRVRETRRSDRYLLTGLLICEKCGNRMVGRPIRGTRKYQCVATGVAHLAIVAEPLEVYVTAEAARMALVSPETIADLSTVSPELREEQAEIEQRLAEIADAVADGELSPVTAGKAERKLTAKLEAIAAEVAKIAGRYDYLAGDGGTARDALDAVVDHVTVRAAGRGSRTPVTERVEIVWRDGVEQVAP